MRRRLTAAVLATALTAAGCAAEPPVSPLPTEAPASATPPRSASPSVSPRALPPTSALPSPPAPTRSSRRPVVTTHPSPASSPPPSCQGAVVHTIDLTTDEVALVPALCLAVGAVLRIENIGPGEVTTDEPDLVDQNYEAGIVEIRFVRTGTVVVTIPQEGTAHDITVVIR